MARAEISREPEVLSVPTTVLGGKRVSLRLDQGTLLLRIRAEDRNGHYVHGPAEFLLDSVVETHAGAVGRPVKRKLKDPFVVLGPFEQAPESNPAGSESLRSAGYDDIDTMARAAAQMVSRLGQKVRGAAHGDDKGVIVAFPRGDDFDLLVARGDKLVYRERDLTFVSSDEKSVIVDDCGVAISKADKSVAIAGGCVSVRKGGKTVTLEDGTIDVEKEGYG